MQSGTIVALIHLTGRPLWRPWEAEMEMMDFQGAGPGPGRTGGRMRARLMRVAPLFARTGPVTLTLSCMALIALLALVYLAQVSAVAAGNERLRALQSEQTRLLRQDQLAHARLGQAQSPAYIRQRARELGLVPAPPGSVIVIEVPAMDAQSSQGGQP
jgi:hypothetical protein